MADLWIPPNRNKKSSVDASHAEKVRAVIRKHLAAMAKELGQFEQTCLGFLGTPSCDWVARSLIETYSDPSARNLNELTSAIDMLAKLG